MAKALKLDIHKFRKVRALMDGGATEGERQAARSRAKAIAAKACMDLDAALGEDDRLKKQGATTAASKAQPVKPSNPFEEFFNSPEMKAQRAERANKDAAKRERVLKEYGSIEAVFNPIPWETALREAIAPFSELNRYTCVSGVERLFTQYLDGEMAGDALEGTARAKATIAAAFPMPSSIGAAMAEVKVWNKLRWDRALFFESSLWGYYPESEVTIRQRLVEKFLAAAPVTSWQDMEDRFAWKRYEFESEYLDPVVRDDPFMDRIEEDFRILRAMADRQPEQGQDEIRTDLQTANPPASRAPDVQYGRGQNGHRTNADKAAAVQDILTRSPELSDRAIGRMAGVSPQTVSNWRSRMKAPAAS